MFLFRMSVLGGAVLILGLPLPVPAQAAQEQAPPAAVVVHISNFSFNSQTVVVPAGTTVAWVNDDDDPHTVVATDKTFHSRALDTGDRFAFTFAKAGTYAYFCSLHPHMTGKVIVQAR